MRLPYRSPSACSMMRPRGGRDAPGSVALVPRCVCPPVPARGRLSLVNGRLHEDGVSEPGLGGTLAHGQCHASQGTRHGEGSGWQKCTMLPVIDGFLGHASGRCELPLIRYIKTRGGSALQTAAASCLLWSRLPALYCKTPSKARGLGSWERGSREPPLYSPQCLQGLPSRLSPRSRVLLALGISS